MNKKLSKTPSLLVEPRKSQPDILDDIAVTDTSVVVDIKNKSGIKFIYLSVFVLILLLLFGGDLYGRRMWLFQ